MLANSEDPGEMPRSSEAAFHLGLHRLLRYNPNDPIFLESKTLGFHLKSGCIVIVFSAALFTILVIYYTNKLKFKPK